jgi:hypothetical protein
MRTDALTKELGDVSTEFDAWAAKELTGVNSELTQKSLQEIKPLTRQEWESTDTKATP